MSSNGVVIRANATQNVPRLFVDITKFAALIIQQARSSHVPLTDDCSAIRQLCEKIECLLLIGLKPIRVGIFGTKKKEPEYFTFLRAVCKQSKSLIDGLRYINIQSDLKTDLGRGRGLVRYFLTQNCLGDVMQNAVSDQKTLRYFFTEGALIRHSAMHHVIESLYALYNIEFAVLADLDVNWMTSRNFQQPAVPPFAAATSYPPSVPYHNDNIQKWLSSGIGSESEKVSQIRSHGNTSTREAEMEEKQEIMARVISDLESKNFELETQLNLTEAELKIKPDMTLDRILTYTPRLGELNDSIINQSRNSRKNIRSCSTPYSLAVPLSPTSRKTHLLRSAVGLEFETMSNLSENSNEKKNDTLSSTKTPPDISSPERKIRNQKSEFEYHSGIEPLSTKSGRRFSAVHDSDIFPTSLIDGYHRQIEACDDRLIALEADNRIIREEKRRFEEICDRLGEENDTLNDRLREINENHSPSSGEFLAKEMELLLDRVQSLGNELDEQKSIRHELEESLQVLTKKETVDAQIQTTEKGIKYELLQQENNNLLRKNADLEDRINNIDAKFAKKIRDLENENQKTTDIKVSELEVQISDLEEHVTCLDADLNMKTKQCREIQEDVERMTHQLSEQERYSLPQSPAEINNLFLDYAANYRARNQEE